MAIPMPGPYQVSDTIQEILKRRRDESRQAMLDKLNMDESQSQMKYRDDQTKMQRDSNQSEMDYRKLMGDKTREDIVTSQIDSMGDIEQEISPEWKTANPALYEELTKRQRIRKDTVTPKAGTSYEAQLPEGATPEQIEAFAQAMEAGQTEDLQPAGPQESREMFTGSPEFQRTRHAQGQLREAANAPDMTDDLRNFLMLQASGAQNVPGQLMSQRNLRTISHTGKVSNPIKVGPYDDTVNLPQPYQMPSWGAPKAYQEMERTTGRVIRTHMANPEQAAFLAEQAAQQGHVLVPTTAPFGPNAGQERAKDLAAREFGRAFTSNSPRAQRNAELNQHRTGLIMATVVSDPTIKQALNRASEQLLSAVEAQGSVPSDSAQRAAQRIREAYPNMSGEDVAEVMETLNLLLANLPKTERPPTRGANPPGSGPVPAAPIAGR